MTMYYHRNTSSLSNSGIKSIIAKAKTFLVNPDNNDRKTIKFPLAIMHFGKDDLLHSLT